MLGMPVRLPLACMRILRGHLHRLRRAHGLGTARFQARLEQRLTLQSEIGDGKDLTRQLTRAPTFPACR
jgi:hypothetical protein